LGEIAKGTDPAVLRHKMKAAPTLEAFSSRYLTEVSDIHKKASSAGTHSMSRSKVFFEPSRPIHADDAPPASCSDARHQLGKRSIRPAMVELGWNAVLHVRRAL
jgi:hypothetical protein